MFSEGHMSKAQHVSTAFATSVVMIGDFLSSLEVALSLQSSSSAV